MSEQQKRELVLYRASSEHGHGGVIEKNTTCKLIVQGDVVALETLQSTRDLQYRNESSDLDRYEINVQQLISLMRTHGKRTP